MTLRSKFTWLLLIAVLAGGATYWQMRRTAVPAGAPVAPAATAAAATEAVVELQPEDVSHLSMQTLTQTLPVSGNLKALNSVSIKARVAGELLILQGREGDSVKAGQVIAKIDPVEFQRRLRQAEQQADAAKTQIDIALRQYDNNKALVDQCFVVVVLA